MDWTGSTIMTLNISVKLLIGVVFGAGRSKLPGCFCLGMIECAFVAFLSSYGNVLITFKKRMDRHKHQLHKESDRSFILSNNVGIISRF